MKYTDVNNVKVYTVNTDKTLPNWLSDSKRRALLKADDELRSRINLIQDFEFPTAATNIKICKDENYILATGVYKPRVNCYDTSQLSMKFTRYMNADVVNFLPLTDDFRKIAFLLADRTIEIHAAFGYYYRTRIPRFGRDIAYNQENCDLYTVGASNEIWRLNLDVGQFQPSLQGSSEVGGFNVCAMNEKHMILGVGGEDGSIEMWDPRSSKRVSRLSNILGGSSGSRDSYEVTSMRFADDGLNMAVGTSNGEVLVYDIRSRKPMLHKDHQYGFPIKKIVFHNGSDNILSADKKVIKIWNKNTGKAFTTVEPEADINDICIPTNESSGLILTANETPKMNAYYIPELGTAPKWCHHLDSITEELEEKRDNSMYDDYKFVNKKDLAKLGLDSLVGTNLLRGYMHGYFVDKRLYNEAKAVAEPFDYSKYKKQKIEKKVREQRENRIGVVKKLPKVNQEYAMHILEADKKTKKGSNSSKSKNSSPAATAEEGVTPMTDDRFGALWNNPEFAIDTESEAYKIQHPHANKDTKGPIGSSSVSNGLFEQFERMDESDADSDEDSKIKQHRVKTAKASSAAAADKKTKGPKMFEISEGHKFTQDGEKIKLLQERRKLANAPLGLRVQSNSEKVTDNNDERNRIINVDLKKPDAVIRREQEQKQHMKERREARRSVKDLNLPKVRDHTSYRKK